MSISDLMDGSTTFRASLDDINTVAPADSAVLIRAEAVAGEARPRNGLLNTAERELSAFMTAVSYSYGLEQARLSAEDWVDELEAMDGLPDCSSQWRRITIAAAARLANRLMGNGNQTTPINGGDL